MAKKLINTTTKLGVGTLLAEAVIEHKNLITVLKNSNQATSGAWADVIWNTNIRVGHLLTSTSNSVVVGEGVSVVMVSASLWVSSPMQSYAFMRVVKNGVVATTTITDSTSVSSAGGGNQWGNPKITPILLQVAPGDVLKLQIETLKTSTTVLGGSYAASCYMTVEVIA